MKTAENQKQPVAVTHPQHEFGVTNEMDQELQNFLISRTEGEALEVVRRAEREPGLEQWRRLAALYEPPQASENLDQLPKNMRLAIILSTCPTDFEKQLTAQQHLFLDYAQMKAQIVTVINNPTRGLAPMMMGNLRDEDSNHHASGDDSVENEDGELYRLQIRNGKKVFTESRHEPNKGKGGGKGTTDRECFRCGRIGHIRADCRAKRRTPKICAQREECRKL